MGKLKRMGAELLKIRRTWILWLHVLMPLVGIGLFLFYYHISAWSDWGKISAYVQALAVVCPTLIGFVCALSAEQEVQAGHFQNFLGTGRHREGNLAVKLVVLMLLGLLAMVLAVGGFGIGYRLTVSDMRAPVGMYAVVLMLLWILQIFEYCFHIFLGIRFSKGVSVGAGIVESLIAALMLTGLGEGIWQWVPCAWAVRFTGYYIENTANGGTTTALMGAQMKLGGVTALGITLVAVVLLFLWFHGYEGKRLED